MPPKAVTVADSSAHTALTAGETTMLAAVCAQLGDVPKQVDFEIVAQICGIKYSRNARSSCKKLFEKIKAAHPEVNIVAGGSGNTVSEAAAEDGSDENDGSEAPKRARPVAKKAPKKTVGKTTAPKKVGATSKKASTKKGAAAKAKAAAASKGDSDDADVEDAEEESVEAMKDEAGKVPTASACFDLSFVPTQVEFELTIPTPLVPGLGESIVESPTTSVAAPAAGHLVDGNSSADAADVTPDLLVDEAPATNDGVSPSGDLAAETSSAGVGLSQTDQLVAETSSASCTVIPAEQPLTVATSVAVDALAYFVNEVLYMNINGYDYAYCNQDIIDAQSHGITLEQWIIWKFENGVDRATLCG